MIIIHIFIIAPSFLILSTHIHIISGMRIMRDGDVIVSQNKGMVRNEGTRRETSWIRTKGKGRDYTGDVITPRNPTTSPRPPAHAASRAWPSPALCPALYAPHHAPTADPYTPLPTHCAGTAPVPHTARIALSPRAGQTPLRNRTRRRGVLALRPWRAGCRPAWAAAAAAARAAVWAAAAAAGLVQGRGTVVAVAAAAAAAVGVVAAGAAVG